MGFFTNLVEYKLLELVGIEGSSDTRKFGYLYTTFNTVYNNDEYAIYIVQKHIEMVQTLYLLFP